MILYNKKQKEMFGENTIFNDFGKNQWTNIFRKFLLYVYEALLNELDYY